MTKKMMITRAGGCGILMTYRILIISILLSLVSAVSFAPAATAPPPKTYEEILQLSPAEFAQLPQGQALDALNKLSQSGDTKKLAEFFSEYSKTSLSLPADFRFDAKKARFSIEGINAPGGSFFDFNSLRGFLKSKPGLAVSVKVKENGFEIDFTGAGSSKTVEAQGFSAVTFKEGKINLDGNLLEAGNGKTVASRDSRGIVKLDGQGTIAPKAGKEFQFHGKSSLFPDGKIVVEPNSGGMNWVRLDGQRVIPKDEPIAVFSDASKFNAEQAYNKVLITTKDGLVLINPARQFRADGTLTGEFDIGRSINVIGPDGKSVIREEIIVMTPSEATIPPTREMTFDSFFSQLRSSAFDKRSYLKSGRQNNPATVAGLQRILGLNEVDAAGNPVFGELTKAAVMKFQRENGLTGRSVDGIVGPKTYDLLSTKFNTQPSAAVVYSSVDGSARLISDSGIFSGREAVSVLRMAQATVPRLDTWRQELVPVEEGIYSMQGGTKAGSRYVPSAGLGYNPPIEQKGSWTFLDSPPPADEVTPGFVTHYYTPVWDPLDTTGASHENWRDFMKAVRIEGSGLYFNQDEGRWYHVNYIYAKAYLKGVRGNDLPSMEPLRENIRFGEVAKGGTPVIGSIAAPPEVPLGSRAYVKTAGGKWVELKVVDRGSAITNTGGRYHIDIWAGIGKTDYNKGKGGLTGQYRIPARPSIRWVYPKTA